MGVPITFLDKYNPDQFIIIGLDRYVADNPRFGHRFTVNGKETYARILIKRECSGVMGVPITFLSKYNPKQFKIAGLANSARYIGDFPCYMVIDGKKIYNRILIKRRKKDENST